jgi:hypothetical protein
LAVSFPRDRWIAQGSVMLENGRRRLRGNAFRGYVHPVRAMEALLREAGFKPVHPSRSFVWHANIYSREAT